jgi:hypothetical protein
MTEPLFYDVPSGLVRDHAGEIRMRYTLFSDPFEAMSYAWRMRHNMPGPQPLQINRRPWGKDVLAKSCVLDCRGTQT